MTAALSRTLPAGSPSRSTRCRTTSPTDDGIALASRASAVTKYGFPAVRARSSAACSAPGSIPVVAVTRARTSPSSRPSRDTRSAPARARRARTEVRCEASCRRYVTTTSRPGTSADARCSSSRRLAASAACRSSSRTANGVTWRRYATTVSNPRSRAPSASNDGGRSPRPARRAVAPSGTGTSGRWTATAARTCSQGHNAGTASWSGLRPQTTGRTSPAASSCSSRVLPTPGSPSTTTSAVPPPRAAAAARWRTSRSAVRPTRVTDSAGRRPRTSAGIYAVNGSSRAFEQRETGSRLDLLAQDGRLQLSQPRTRVDPQLVGEDRPHPPQRRRVRPPAVPT